MTEQQVLQKLTALCSAAEYCCHDMTEKMRRWEVDEAVQARIMEYLIRERYIDEERYCRYFVKDKLRFNKWGRRKIEVALVQKRVPKEVISAALGEIDDSEYLEILRPLLRQKERSVKAKNDYELNMKLVRFAMSRGFDYEIIRQCLGEELAIDN